MDYDKILRDAEAERAELLSRADKLTKLISFITALATGSTHSASVQAPQSVRATTKRASNIMAPTRDAVAKILRQEQRAMQTAELVPMVQAAGIDVGGKNSVATLSARLSNAAEFKNIRGTGWWFVHEALPNTPTLTFAEVEGSPDQSTPSTSDHDYGGR